MLKKIFRLRYASVSLILKSAVSLGLIKVVSSVSDLHSSEGHRRMVFAHPDELVELVRHSQEIDGSERR